MSALTDGMMKDGSVALWCVLVGCFEPQQTGPDAMVGRVVDTDGHGVSGISVESVEAAQLTGDDGAFAVRFKAPDQFVHFRRDDVWYRRVYGVEDNGRRVELTLPPARDAKLVCRRDAPCDVELRWELGDRFQAMVSRRCDPGATVSLTAIPRGAPEFRCTMDGVPQQAELSDDGTSLAVAPPRRSVRIAVRGEEGNEPDHCVVQADDQLAIPSGEGAWTVLASGMVTFSATCDGRPALPRVVEVVPDLSVQLDWSPTGPFVDVAAAVPQASDLWLAREPNGGPGWTIQVSAAQDGTFLLPPLPGGTYRVAIGDPTMLDEKVPSDAAAQPSALRTVAVRPGEGASPGSALAFLRLEEDRLEGEIPVVGLE